MWILESDGDFFMGRRMWLKPGKKYLFGRVKKDGVRFAIEHKTISRKHFVISVDAVKPGDTARVHSRSRISITDLKSKQGTSVDGELLSDDTRELKGTEHSIKPGHLLQNLVIRWQPCVLTFSITTKEVKAGALKPKQERLEELDIKVVSEFITDGTTHVVAGKRNTAKGLQALIQGKPIVADSYVDALVYASTPADLGEEENLSPLEQDFENSWPKEPEYLPPPGKEPTIRPDQAYMPRTERNKVFEDFTFVFGDPKQYEQLFPPISLGHGKALLYQSIPGETATDDLIQYMRNTAGHKGFGDARNDSDTGGVIMVRWGGKEPHAEWTKDLINEVALKLDQRAIDQAEFLDAVLANDATLLRSTIPFESIVDRQAAPPPTAVSVQPLSQQSGSPVRSLKQNDTSAVEASGSVTQPLEAVEPTSDGSPASGTGGAAATSSTTLKRPSSATNIQAPPTKRSRLRRAPVATLLDFDDGFDPDAIESGQEPAFTSAAGTGPQSQDYSQSYERDESVSRHPSEAPSVKDEPPSTGKRRRSPVRGHDTFGDDIDDLLPAATAMKRRKKQLEDEARQRGETISPAKSKVNPLSGVKLGKPPRKEREIDVRGELQKEREKDAERARKEHEKLDQEPRSDIDDKAPANLVIIETMKVRKPRAQSAIEGNGVNGHPNWDPSWNGRKNFKRFTKNWPAGHPNHTPAGNNAAQAPQRRRQNVIVPLVEVKRTTYGLGEQYWDRPKEPKKKRGGTQTQTQTQSQASGQRPSAQQRGQLIGTQTVNGSGRSREEDEVERDDDDDDDDDDDTTRPSPELTRLQAEAASIVDHAVNLDTPRRTRADDRANNSPPSTTTRSTVPQKRATAAMASTKGGPASKRQKQQTTIPVSRTVDSDSDDSDDLKFRFTRRVNG